MRMLGLKGELPRDAERQSLGSIDALPKDSLRKGPRHNVVGKHRELGAAMVEGTIVFFPFLLSFVAFLLVSVGFVSIGMVTSDLVLAEIQSSITAVPISQVESLITLHPVERRSSIRSSIETGQPFSSNAEDTSFANYVAGAAALRGDPFGIPADFRTATWAQYPMTAAGVGLELVNVTVAGRSVQDRKMRKSIVGRLFFPTISRMLVFAALVRPREGRESKLTGKVVGTVPSIPVEPVAPVLADCVVSRQPCDSIPPVV